MNVDFLHSFVTVVDAGSLAEAARRLDLTPAAVAARLRALEEELGAPLVQRAGRSVRPTQAGMRILDRAQGLLRDVRDLRAVAATTTLPGEFRLGVFGTALITLVPMVLKRLYARHPQLAVFMEIGSSVSLCGQVAAGELHAAFVIEPQFPLPKNCDWTLLVEEPLVLVAPRTMAGRDPLELLEEEPFIRYDRASPGGQIADRYLRDQGLRPRQRLEIDNLVAITALVGAGLGVSLVPDWPSLATSPQPIVRLPLPGSVPMRRVGLAYALQGPCVSLSRSLLEEAIPVFRPSATTSSGAHAGLGTQPSAA